MISVGHVSKLSLSATAPPSRAYVNARTGKISRYAEISAQIHSRQAKNPLVSAASLLLIHDREPSQDLQVHAVVAVFAGVGRTVRTSIGSWPAAPDSGARWKIGTRRFQLHPDGHPGSRGGLLE